MRDKQLTLRLTAEELEAVKMLALKAGYASLDEFARDELVAQLGRAATESAESSSQAMQLLAQAKFELTRIHQELRVFIVESLSDFTKDPQASLANSLQDVDPVRSINEDLVEQIDELEDLAKQVFASSPQLGALSNLQESEMDSLLSLDESVVDEFLDDGSPRDLNRASADGNVPPGANQKNNPEISGGLPPRKRRI